jgi:ribosomal protein L17
MGDGSWELGVADARSGGFLRIERTKQRVGDGG